MGVQVGGETLSGSFQSRDRDHRLIYSVVYSSVSAPCLVPHGHCISGPIPIPWPLLPNGDHPRSPRVLRLSRLVCNPASRWTQTQLAAERLVSTDAQESNIVSSQGSFSNQEHGEAGRLSRAESEARKGPIRSTSNAFILELQGACVGSVLARKFYRFSQSHPLKGNPSAPVVICSPFWKTSRRPSRGPWTLCYRDTPPAIRSVMSTLFPKAHWSPHWVIKDRNGNQFQDSPHPRAMASSAGSSSVLNFNV